MPSTIKLDNVVRYARQHGALAPLTQVGGTVSQPALDIANDVIMDILTSPNDWRWNQAEMAMLVTCQGKQDYLFAGASAFTLTSGAAVAMGGISVTDGVVTVVTLEPHRHKVGDTVFMTGVVMATGSAAAYASTYTDDGTSSGWSNGWVVTSITSTTFSFALGTGQVNGDSGGAPGITDFGWLSSAYMLQMNSTSSPQWGSPIQALRGIEPSSLIGNPEKVCVYNDLENGILKIRFAFVPSSTAWGALLIYQKKAPLKTSLADTWYPIPDNFVHLCRGGLVYRMYRYLNKTADANIEYQKFQSDIQKAQGYEDNENSDVSLIPEEGLGIGNY